MIINFDNTAVFEPKSCEAFHAVAGIVLKLRYINEKYF